MSRATETENIARPALGPQICNLESDVVALSVRTSLGVSPTPSGEWLLDCARDLLARKHKHRAKPSSPARDLR